MKVLFLKIKGMFDAVFGYLKARPRLRYALCAAAVSLAPLLAAAFLHAMLNTGISFFHTIPATSDEYFYYAQIKGMVEYGAPLGYFGYKGAHAAVGTFGAWGIGTLVPYTLLGKLFGFTYYSMCWMNALFITLANLAFIYLSRLTKRQLAALAAIELVSFYMIAYIGSAMTMSLRYAAALIFAGLFARLYSFETSKLFRRFAVPAIVFFLVWFYYPFAALIPALVLARARSKKAFAARAALSAPVTLACAGLVMLINRYTAAPYYEVFYGDEAAEFLSEMLAHPLAAIPLAFRRLMKKASIINPFNVIFAAEESPESQHPFMFFFICLLAAVFILIIANLVDKRPQDTRNRVFTFFAAYALGAMTFGFLLFNRYSRFDNLNRETSIALFAACCALVLTSDGKLIKRLVILSLVGIVPFWTSYYYSSHYMSGYASDDDLAYFATRAETYSQYIKADPHSGEWQNTVALLSCNWRPLLWAPAGLGFNMHTDAARTERLEEKYIIACTKSGCASCADGSGNSAADRYELDGYILLYEDTDTDNAILLNPRYGG